MDLHDLVAFFVCLLVCCVFCGIVVHGLIVLQDSKWELILWITLMALSFYSSWLIFTTS